MRNPDGFYDAIRKSKLFGPTFSSSEFNGIQEIVKDCEAAKWPIPYIAYALATAYHETAGTMQPIKEYGGPSYFTKLYDIKGQNPARARRMGNVNPGDGPKYCGRGYVQLTWYINYLKAEKELGQPLTTNPDLALKADIASDIMIKGMEEGWFTGKKLSDYLPKTGAATLLKFKAARYIINGQDDAELIAAYALKFQQALYLGD